MAQEKNVGIGKNTVNEGGEAASAPRSRPRVVSDGAESLSYLASLSTS